MPNAPRRIGLTGGMRLSAGFAAVQLAGLSDMAVAIDNGGAVAEGNGLAGLPLDWGISLLKGNCQSQLRLYTEAPRRVMGLWRVLDAFSGPRSISHRKMERDDVQRPP